MRKRDTDIKVSNTYVVSSASAGARLLTRLLRFFKKKVYCRETYEKKIVRDKPSDFYEMSNSSFGKFCQKCVDQKCVEKISRAFNLRPEVLYSCVFEYFIKTNRYDYCFSLLASKRLFDEKVVHFFNLPPAWIDMLESEHKIKAHKIFSYFLLLEKRSILFAKSFVKVMHYVFVLLCWAFTKRSDWAKKISGQFFWLPSGQMYELAVDEDKLSLPLYLRQFLESSKFKDNTIVVSAPFIKKGLKTDKERILVLPRISSVNPGVFFTELFSQVILNLKAIFFLLFSFFDKSEVFEAASMAADINFYKFWFKKIEPKAFFYTQSALGAASPFLHAAFDLKISTLLIYYSSTALSPVLNKAYYGLTPPEYLNINADYIGVWNHHTKNWFSSIGRNKGVFICGPQMFASVKSLAVDKDNKIKVGVYFITPRKKDLFYQWGMGECFRDADYCWKFWENVFRLTRKVFNDNCCFVIKFKHPVSERLTIEWFDRIKEYYPDADQFIKIYPPDSNPWKVIAHTDIGISMPFTSIAEPVKAMAKPSIYYDPMNKVQPLHDSEVPLIFIEEDLLKWLNDCKDGLGRPTFNGEFDSFGPTALAKKCDALL